MNNENKDLGTDPATVPADKFDAPALQAPITESVTAGQAYVDPVDIDEEASDAPDFFAKFNDDDAAVEAEVFDADALPAFDFAVAPVVSLKDGTEFTFKIPDLASERRADALRKTLILTSPARVDGFNPTQETTDYATAEWRYFLDNLVKVKGFALNEGDDPNAVLDATTVIRTDKDAKGREHRITVAHLIPAKHARTAVNKMYGGKIEVEKPVEKRVKVLNETRHIVVIQQFGVEQNDDGTFSDPTHIVKYIFREATSHDLGRWQTKCFLGHKIPIKGGGAREERYFNTDKTVELFDRLIVRVENAVFNGQPINAADPADLNRIPAGVRKTAVTIAMGDAMGDVGN